MVPSNFKDISAERPPSIPAAYTTSKEIGVIAKEIAVLTGYLLKGLLIFLGRKARAEGIPKAMQFSYWLKKQNIILARKSVEVGTPKAIEDGRISREYKHDKGIYRKTHGKNPRNSIYFNINV